MNAQTIEWSDIPFLLAVCEAGSLSGAARTLNVNHSTVFRRIENLEKRLGVRLFERLSRGYVMTPAGEKLYETARTLRGRLQEIELKISGQDLRLEGSLTVTTTDTLLHCLSPMFAAFQIKHPEIELRLLTDERALDLMQRDADVALRPTPSPPEHWVGRKISKLGFATYAHEAYWQIAQTRAPQDIRWLMLADDLNQSPMSKLTIRAKAGDTRVCVANTMMGVFDMVKSGLGVAAMPCYLGDRYPDLIRIDEPDDSFGWDLWLLAHPDVRRSARVNAFYDFASKNTARTLALKT